MSESEQKKLAWRAFFLGARATIDAYGIILTDSNRHAFIQTLGDIADSKATLTDPEILSKTNDAKLRAIFAEQSRNAIDTDRKLAVVIREGLNNICDAAA